MSKLTFSGSKELGWLSQQGGDTAKLAKHRLLHPEDQKTKVEVIMAVHRLANSGVERAKIVLEHYRIREEQDMPQLTGSTNDVKASSTTAEPVPKPSSPTGRHDSVVPSTPVRASQASTDPGSPLFLTPSSQSGKTDSKADNTADKQGSKKSTTKSPTPGARHNASQTPEAAGVEGIITESPPANKKLRQDSPQEADVAPSKGKRKASVSKTSDIIDGIDDISEWTIVDSPTESAKKRRLDPSYEDDAGKAEVNGKGQKVIADEHDRSSPTLEPDSDQEIIDLTLDDDLPKKKVPLMPWETKLSKERQATKGSAKKASVKKASVKKTSVKKTSVKKTKAKGKEKDETDAKGPEKSALEAELDLSKKEVKRWQTKVKSLEKKLQDESKE
jgi:hypothetical protein